MRSNVQAFLFLLVFSVVWFYSCTDAASQDDEVTVYIQLDISSLHEEKYNETGNFVTDISLTRYGFYTFTRLNNGSFQAVPGMSSSVKMPETLNLAIQQTHPCQDGQSLVIGTASRALNGRVHQASGWIKANSAGGNRMVLHLLPTEIVDYDTLECTNHDCNNGFSLYRLNTIGEDRDAYEEDEDGYQIVYGYDLTEIDFDTLREIAKGGELPLTIPISIHKTYRLDYPNPSPGDIAQELVTFRVNGFISQVPTGDI